MVLDYGGMVSGPLVGLFMYLVSPLRGFLRSSVDRFIFSYPSSVFCFHCFLFEYPWFYIYIYLFLISIVLVLLLFSSGIP